MCDLGALLCLLSALYFGVYSECDVFYSDLHHFLFSSIYEIYSE
jgi:hypothetical protein